MEPRTQAIQIPKGWSVNAVYIVTGIGHFSYPLEKAIQQGHIRVINRSTNRYEAVLAGSTQAIRVILSASR